MRSKSRLFAFFFVLIMHSRDGFGYEPPSNFDCKKRFVAPFYKRGAFVGSTPVFIHAALIESGERSSYILHAIHVRTMKIEPVMSFRSSAISHMMPIGSEFSHVVVLSDDDENCLNRSTQLFGMSTKKTPNKDKEGEKEAENFVAQDTGRFMPVFGYIEDLLFDLKEGTLLKIDMRTMQYRRLTVNVQTGELPLFFDEESRHLYVWKEGQNDKDPSGIIAYDQRTPEKPKARLRVNPNDRVFQDRARFAILEPFSGDKRKFQFVEVEDWSYDGPTKRFVVSMGDLESLESLEGRWSSLGHYIALKDQKAEKLLVNNYRTGEEITRLNAEKNTSFGDIAFLGQTDDVLVLEVRSGKQTTGYQIYRFQNKKWTKLQFSNGSQP